MRTLLQVNRLYVQVGGKTIIHGVELEIGKEEEHILMGPNAAGKSALLKTIMGDPRYKIVKGTVFFDGMNITNMKPYERARLGLALAYQNPPSVSVKFDYFMKKLLERFGAKGNDFVKELNVTHLLQRKLFEGFSGGEAKRTELLLTLLQKPKLALLDEPDSGVDIDSISIIANAINSLIDVGSSILLVTHSGHILQYLKRVDALHVMVGGRITYSGDLSVINDILRFGYEKFSKYEVINYGSAKR